MFSWDPHPKNGGLIFYPFTTFSYRVVTCFALLINRPIQQLQIQHFQQPKFQPCLTKVSAEARWTSYSTSAEFEVAESVGIK